MQSSFNTAANVAGDWTSPSQLATSINTQLYSPAAISAMFTVCSALPAFQTCLNVMFVPCLRVSSLVAGGVAQSNAINYMFTMLSTRYRCSTGLEVLFANRQCLSVVRQRSQAVLTNCITAYASSMAGGQFSCRFA